jgi:hypothetical protein
MYFCGDKAQHMTENLQGVSECVNLHVIVTGKCVSWLVVQIRQSKHMLGAPSFAVKLQGAATLKVTALCLVAPGEKTWNQVDVHV